MEEKENITEEIKNTDELVLNDEAGEISQLLSKGTVVHMMQYSHYYMVLTVKMVRFKDYLK